MMKSQEEIHQKIKQQKEIKVVLFQMLKKMKEIKILINFWLNLLKMDKQI
jgi:hypothetical protein